MAFRQKSSQGLKVIATCYALLLSVSYPGMSYAQSDNMPNIPSPMEIAKQIEDNSLVHTSNNRNIENPKTISDIINQIIELAPSGDQISFDAALDTLASHIEKTQHKDGAQILEIFRGYSDLSDFEKINSNYEDILEYLTEASLDKSWFVKFHVKRIISVQHSNARKANLALQTAQEALELIPNELNDETINARINATELLAYLQNLTLNKDLALLNTQRLIDLKLEAGQPVDGIELINNLMYSLTSWRDNEARLQLAQTLKRLERKYGSTTPGLSSIHISKVYIDTGEYEKAIQAATDALGEARLDSLQKIARINLATAYAGLGQTNKAKSILSVLPEDSQGRYSIPYAKAVIALKEGRLDEALRLMNERYDARVRSFLEENSKNTTEMLATLENSSERQAEREAALKREADLIQTRLDQQQDINRLLLALIGLVSLTGIGSLIFARHRHKLAKLLAVKTEEAESADRMKTEFLGMVSHELRTPLNGIIGIADVLAAQGPTQEVRDRSNIILSSGNVLFNLIESIIDMSRIDGDKLELLPEPTRLTDIVQDLAARWGAEAETKNIPFTCHIDEACHELIQIDPIRIHQCIDTLLSNAVKFTESGRVHLHVTASQDKNSTNRSFNVIVADTGQGMSEAVQAKLFKPFLQADSSMTRKYGGSGLRLAIARSMAQMMEGDIIVNSREGRGSEFTLTFSAPLSKDAELEKSPEVKHDIVIDKSTTLANIPSANEEPDCATPDNCDPITDEDNVFEMIELVIDQTKKPEPTETVFGTIEDNSLEGCRVLIVEDMPSNQDVIELFLTPEGIKTFPVDNGLDALKMLATNPFDFVIMDIRMPGMDGLETTQHIRRSGEAWANIPIIALTADTGAENNAACMAAGTDVFLTKPVLAKELLGAMQFLRQQRERSQGEAPLLLRNIV